MSRRAGHNPLHLEVAVVLLSMSICGVALAAPSPQPPPESSRWVEVRSPGFDIVSNASAERAVRTGVELETFRASLREMLPMLRRDALRPAAVYAFDSRRMLTRFSDAPRQVGGVFVPTPLADVIAFDVATATRFQHVFHEYVHQVLRDNFDALPAWLNEGLAYYFQTFRFQDGGVEVGHRPPGLSRSPALSLQGLFSTFPGSARYGTKEFAAQSWVLVHYLLSLEGPERQRVTALLAAIQAGEPSGTAFESGFDTTLPELEARVRRYVRSGGLRSRHVAVPPRRFERELEARPLEHAEALARLGELLRTVPGDLEGAQRMFDAALRRDPSNVGALTGLALVRREQGRLDEARTLLDRAVDEAPETAAVWFARGEVSLDRFARWRETREDGAAQLLHPALLQARDAYARATELDPSLVAAVNGFAHTYLFDPETRQPGIEACEGALARVRRPELALTLVQLYSDDANPGGAHTARERYLVPLRASFGGHGEGSGRTPWDSIARSLTLADMLLAERLLEAGRPDEALEVLVAARDAAPRELWAQLDRRADELRAGSRD